MGPAESTCGKPATHHVFWDEEGDNAYACAEHHAEIRKRWDLLPDPRPLTMLWDAWGAMVPGRECVRHDDDELPVTEERELAGVGSEQAYVR